jgi:stalled ribosome alternative rescue factor ArfA
VAELVAEIFPFEIVARQHGTLPRKVAEALAAVVQVPLLRCATDKRRTGKLGSERMKEFREARKGWVAMVREWEREKEGEKDAEGEVDDEVVGNSAVGRGTGQAVDPRAVSQPGEPSALDVALMLPPTNMPAQMLRENFFTGPW